MSRRPWTIKDRGSQHHIITSIFIIIRGADIKTKVREHLKEVAGGAGTNTEPTYREETSVRIPGHRLERLPNQYSAL